MVVPNEHRIPCRQSFLVAGRCAAYTCDFSAAILPQAQFDWAAIRFATPVRFCLAKCSSGPTWEEGGRRKDEGGRQNQPASDRTMSVQSPAHFPADFNEALIVANPKAGWGPAHARVDRLVEGLRQHGITSRVVHDLSEVAGRAAEGWQAGHLRTVIAAGGDGTVAEVINRIPQGVPLSVFPLGTENLLSKYLKMPRQPEILAATIARGTVIPHDAGEAGGRLFALMASCGFDAEIVRKLHAERTGHIGHLSYLKPIWQTIRSYEYPELRITCDDWANVRPTDIARATDWTSRDGAAPAGGSAKLVIHCRFAFLMNVPRYAFGLQFTPRALGDDGRLDLCAFRRGYFGWGLWYFVNLVLRRHGRLADCQLIRARRFRIESDRSVPYELDGDPGGYLPLDITIQPGRLTLLVAPEVAAELHAVNRAQIQNC